MANSFNISVKPEIAAAVVKIDAIDTVVDAIRATDVPGINTNINANETKIDSIDTMVTLVRFTDFPAIAAEINANETKIDTIDGIADAIKLKTDAMPQLVRGDFKAANLNIASTDWVDLVNVTGSGKLIKLNIGSQHADTTVYVQMTIDSVTSTVLSQIGDVADHIVIPRCYSHSDKIELIVVALIGADVNLFNVEFSTSLLIQVKSGAEAGSGYVYSLVYYSLDTF